MRIEEHDERDELPAGTELDGRFRIRSMLGEGGIGHVYLAQDLERGHDVALKILIPRYRGRPEREQRLLNEAVFARRVGEHPNMPQLYGSGRLHDLEDCPYVAWEVVHGRDLNALLIQRNVLPPRLAANFARQLAEALCAMHQAGVVHRDVTVTNVFIERPDGDARVKLIDLSHAAFVPEAGAPRRRLTREIEIPGAHRFMPPEQTMALPPHPKMDVFSFGVVLHEMLTGCNPFEDVRDRDTYIEMQRAGKLHVPRIDRRVYPNVPDSLVDLVEGCTRNDVALRMDMPAVLRRLDEILVRMSAPVRLVTAEPTEADRVEPNAATPIEAPSGMVVGPAPVEAHDMPQERRSTVRLVVVVALVTMLLTAAVLWLVWRPVGSVDAPGSGPAPVVEPGPEVVEPGQALPAVEPAPAPTKPTELAPQTEPVKDVGQPTPTTGEPAASTEPPAGKSKAAPTKTPAHETEACRRTVAAALAADNQNAWSRLEPLTRKKKCFGDRDQWVELRVRALLETKRFDECIARAADSTNPSVQRYASICRLNKGKP